MIVSWLVKVLFRFPSHIRIDRNQNTRIWDSSNWIWKSLEGSDPKLKKEHVFHSNHDNSVFGRLIDVLRPYNFFTSHIWPSPKIWFETEQFEFLSFRAPAWFLAYSQIEIEITLEEKPNGTWQIYEFILSPLEEINKTQKSFRNRRILIFQPNFVKTQFS